MKKTVSFLLALILLCCMAVPAYAADTRNTEVSLTVDGPLESYEVSIPPTITLDAAAFATNGGGKTALNVTINKLSAVWSTRFYIYVASKNGFNLVNTEDPSKVIPYGCYCANSITITSNNNAGKTYPYYDNDSISYILNQGLPYNTTRSYSNGGLMNGYLYRDGSDAYPGSGTYTDTLTFTFAFSNK